MKKVDISRKNWANVSFLWDSESNGTTCCHSSYSRLLWWFVTLKLLFTVLFSLSHQISFFLSSYVVPLTLISVLYVCMLASLWKGTGTRISAESRYVNKFYKVMVTRDCFLRYTKALRWPILMEMSFPLWLEITSLLLCERSSYFHINNAPFNIINVTETSI